MNGMSIVNNRWLRYLTWSIVATLALSLTIIQGCGLFKGTTKTTEKLNVVATEDSTLKVSEKKTLTSALNGVFLHKDSSSTDYSVLIYPKGSFSITSDGSFSGEAEKIQISGKNRDFGSSATQMNLQVLDKGTRDAAANTSKRSTTSLKEALSTSSWWSWQLTVLVTLLLIALCLAIFRQKHLLGTN